MSAAKKKEAFKPGDLVKYKSTRATPAWSATASAANYKFKWTRQQCADNLIGLVTKIEDKKVYVHWFYLNEIIWEYENWLKVIE